jgi:hypothetical protein
MVDFKLATVLDGCPAELAAIVVTLEDGKPPAQS